MTKNLLDYAYDHEVALGNKVFLTQPTGNNQTVDYTWGETMDQARRMATYLKAQNFEPGARIAILSKNCAHFIMAELAIWMAGYTTVAIFPTETADTVSFVLEHSGASMLFVGKLDTWKQQQPGVPAGMPCIAFPLSPKNDFKTWDTVISTHQPLAGRPQRADTDLCLLMYTSGSTGQPKGVMHDFAHGTAAAQTMADVMKDRIAPKSEVRVLSYLPLAHIFERAWVECASLVYGNVHIFFADSLDTFVADLNRARPTFFISVPRLWLKFQQGVFAKMPAKKLDRLLSIPILGRIVARKVLRGLGLDNVILAGSGSAPIPPDLIKWYRKLGLNLLEGYAMTEDFACSYFSTPELNAPGYVGGPMPGVQVRLSEEHEVLVKSPGQLVGYYKRPDLDAEVFTADGFFRTGDKGEINDRGMLKLTGRVKELFKTTKGKYVSPAPIENRINSHSMVELSLVGGSGQSAAYGLVVLSETVRPRLKDPEFCKEVETEFGRLLKELNAVLPDYEKLHTLVVVREPWTIENGSLTPTMKIKRSRIEGALQPAQIDAWYASKAPVQWL